MKRKLLFFLVFIKIANLVAQNNDENIAIQAQDFFEKNYYKESLALLTNYEKNHSLSSRGLFLKALNLYQLNRLELAKEVLLGLIIDQQQAPFAELWLYLGKINHHQYEFEEAAKYYKTYLRSVEGDTDLKKSIVEEIRRCSNGRKEKYKVSGNFVENFGSQVNSSEDEFNPVESRIGSTEVYFSAMLNKNNGGKREENGKINEREGSFYSDMYRTTNLGGKWTSPNALHFLLNSPQHEILIGFDQEEQNMYFFRGNSLLGGEVMRTSYSASEDLGKKSNSFYTTPELNIREGGFQVYDASLVLFAARLPGGYGGLDLYYSIFSEGEWSNPINLGSEINSAYDEAYPFLSSDGKTLFYSTNNSKLSLGGYDIVYQGYDKQRDKWNTAISMGMPINSPGDDINFYLARDGFTGYFSSNRRTGYGKKDLYVTYLANAIGTEKSDYPIFVDKPQKRVVVQEEEKVTIDNNIENTLSSYPLRSGLNIDHSYQKEEQTTDKVEKATKNSVIKDESIIEDLYEKKEQAVVKPNVTIGKENSIINEAENNTVKSEKVELEAQPKNLTNDKVENFEMPVIMGSLELGTAEILKEIFNEFLKKRNEFVHLTLSVRSKVPLYDYYKQVEKAANQIIQYLIALGIPSNKIAFRINLNSIVPSQKIFLNYSWKDRAGLPLENVKSFSGDPFSIRMIESPFYYKVSLSGASELKNAALINNYSNPTLEVSPEGNITYNAGQFRTYEGATSFAKQLIDNGLTELKVTPYVYDFKANNKSIRQFVHLFPDFSIYLNQKK